MVEALLPTPRLNHQPEDEAAVAQVQMSEAPRADPKLPATSCALQGCEGQSREGQSCE